MSIVEAPEYTYPNGWVEEDLCSQLSLESVPEREIIEQRFETRISGATVEWREYKAIDTELKPDTVPVILENGLCGSDEAYRALAEALANLGYVVLSKTPPRHQRPDVAYTPHNLLHPMELQSKASWAMMKQFMAQHPTGSQRLVRQFHLLAHSMGGPVATSLAEHHGEHVASMTLIGSAGIERHHTPQMAYRLGKVALFELAPAMVLPGRITNRRLAKATAKHMFSVMNRTAREALQVSNYNNMPGLKRLKSADIPLYNIQPRKDHFFAFANQLHAIHLFERFISFNVGRADHLAPQTQSKLVALVFQNLQTEPDFSFLAA